MWFHEQITHDIAIKEIILNFMPSWWYKNYQIGYGKPMYFDCDYRMEADQAMRKYFYDRFGRFMNAGTRDPRPRVVAPDWDNTYFQTMLGFNTQYPVDQYPMAHGQLSDDEAMKLEVPENLWDVFPFNEQARQIREMNRKLDADAPLWMRTRGLLNEGVQICGSDFYGALLDEDYEEITDHVFEFISGVIKQQLLSNQKCDPTSGHIMMNCTAAIAGAPTYSSCVYPYDKRLYDFCIAHNIPIGLHHCGKFDDFVEIYAPMTALNFIEIGHSSKIRPVLERYPNADIQYIVDTKFMREASVPEVQAFCQGVREQVAGHEARFHLSVPDLEFGTPDENILALVDAFHR